MKVFLFIVLGLFLGAIVGGFVGVGAGILYTEIAHTSNFEGGAGMLVFFGFMPAGIFVGAAVGAIWLGAIAVRRSVPHNMA